ncbi:hypothetical protein G7075_13340 [Phycicoccus sp. HDW14]|uniref:hypothetical protein n=1 Tax=Phycicoccus sp. HDW14 TaxID=2714941 RepID=UPI00140E3277|nr:hypothetical protein [Phycicoccus sp. HDW14]QIM21877.1 hypothetical protein G7075_13340 [Phycicoccus sp. HDW14]
MTAWSTLVRSTHLVTNAAWFGGSLMGAVGLNPAAEEGEDARRRAAIADEGWTRWGPVQGAAVALHLASGVAILVDNRRRVRHHRPTTLAVVAKTVLTGAAVALGAEAYRVGAAFGDAREAADHDPDARAEARALAARLRRLQWATPVTTGAVLVLDAYLGEQQRGLAGLLDRPSLAVH